MKRSLWLLMLFLLAGHVPAASADSACEGRFVNPITDICWSCIFPLSLGSIKVSQGKVPDTANPSMPIQICPAPPPLFRRIGLAIGYWEPMALTDVTRSPGCMVNLGFSLPAFGKTAQGTAKKDEKQVNGAFYHVHWYKYPLTYWLNIITSLGCLEGGDLDIAYLSEIDPTWTDSSLTTILNPEAVTRQIAAFQSQVQVQQDALLVVDRQMSYMRQQLSARMLSRYQNNYHFGGSTL